jgi:phosphate transport system permease protein
MIVNPSRSFRRKLASNIFVAISILAAAIALSALGMILFSLFSKGLAGINMDVFTLETPAPGSKGGLANAIIGSVLMCAVAMVISLFIGILAGTWLAEIGGDTQFGHVVRFLNDVLLSAPSILIGLFVYTMMVGPGSPISLGHFSGWAGAVALAMLATPVVTRTTEDILNLQPNALREAGMALGSSQWVTVKDIIWKAAGAGLLTGGLLGFARISGETAPLLFTSLGNQFFNEPIYDLAQPTSALPTVINSFAMSPYADWQSLAWAGALIVSMAVLLINILGRVIAAHVNK